MTTRDWLFTRPVEADYIDPDWPTADEFVGRWSSPDSDPIGDIKRAMEAFKKVTGEAAKAIVGPFVHTFAPRLEVGDHVTIHSHHSGPRAIDLKGRVMAIDPDGMMTLWTGPQPDPTEELPPYFEDDPHWHPDKPVACFKTHSYPTRSHRGANLTARSALVQMGTAVRSLVVGLPAPTTLGASRSGLKSALKIRHKPP